MADDFDKTILECVAHRPWKMPDGPWLMAQTWHELLFAHWPVPVEDLRSVVPPPFEIDTFAQHAWIGVVPFYMRNVAPRGVPAMSWVSEFPELNVRTTCEWAIGRGCTSSVLMRAASLPSSRRGDSDRPRATGPV